MSKKIKKFGHLQEKETAVFVNGELVTPGKKAVVKSSDIIKLIKAYEKKVKDGG